MPDKMEWHRWFAWHPVRLYSGRIAWLRYVERRRWFVTRRAQGWRYR